MAAPICPGQTNKYVVNISVVLQHKFRTLTFDERSPVKPRHQISSHDTAERRIIYQDSTVVLQFATNHEGVTSFREPALIHYGIDPSRIDPGPNIFCVTSTELGILGAVSSMKPHRTIAGSTILNNCAGTTRDDCGRTNGRQKVAESQSRDRDISPSNIDAEVQIREPDLMLHRWSTVRSVKI